MQTVRQRVVTCKLIEKINRDPEFGRKLGLVNRSRFIGKTCVKRPEGGACR